MSDAKEHWKWLKIVLFEAFRCGFTMNPHNELDWNEQGIIDNYNMIEPLMQRLYLDAFEHGMKHAKEIENDETRNI